ncbi:MAG: MBL fold metallo-hydrolase [Desulfocapsaceae bacterium]|nr:MBL fold metallo-hydrolase [Desulfocapsaceae bacterium]
MFYLYAMPLKSGDCFILDLEKERFVIDGGGIKGIVDVIRQSVGACKPINALICTHSDWDHAHGVKFIIQNYPGNIHEVWLPATWGHLINSIMQVPSQRALNELLNVDSLNRIDMKAQFHPKQ